MKNRSVLIFLLLKGWYQLKEADSVGSDNAEDSETVFLQSVI